MAAETTMSDIAEMAEETMAEAASTIASYFNNVNVVKNDGLYAPLTQEGTVCGVGLNLSLIHDPPLFDGQVRAGTTYKYIINVDSVEYNTPAYKAGLLADDVIIQVDNTNLIDGQAFYLPDDVANLIRGKEGSTVIVTVEREGKILRFSMRREPVTKEVGSPSLSDTVMRKVMPVTPEGNRQLDSFEDRIR